MFSFVSGVFCFVWSSALFVSLRQLIFTTVVFPWVGVDRINGGGGGGGRDTAFQTDNMCYKCCSSAVMNVSKCLLSRARARCFWVHFSYTLL